MDVEVKLPELGEGVTEGELIKWLVKVGDSVKPDQSIAEVMTDKATVEVPTPVAGVVKELKFKSGDTITVESVMITLEGSATVSSVASATTAAAPAKASVPPAPTKAPARSPELAAMASAAPGKAAAPATGLEVIPPAADVNVLATPATRRLARELGVNINTIVGTGLAGRVTREDILGQHSTAASSSQEAAAVASALSLRAGPALPAGAMEERVALRGVRKKIAENMQLSKSIIPHFTLADEADVSELVALREGLREVAEKAKTKITYLPFVMKALIATIRQYPQFNASIDDAASEIVYKKYFNIGFAADTPNGLVVPVIKNADQKTILQLSQEILDLATRARDGKLKLEEMRGATISITNIGSVGGTYATPIINHPEVAILGMYKIQDKPVIKNGALSAIKVMNFTITADHRLIDGAVAANFLKSFLARIEKPGLLMMDLA